MVDECLTAFPGGIARCRVRQAILVTLLLSSALGCQRNSAATAQTASAASPVRAATRLSVPGTVVTPSEALTVNELFERGMLRFEKRLYLLAASDLETVARAIPDKAQMMLAYYRAGIARDEIGQFGIAAENFSKAVALGDVSTISRDACTRLIRLLVFLERWADAGEQARAMASQFSNLRPIEAIVVKGATSLAALSNLDLGTAAREIEAARNIIELQQFDVVGTLQRDVAVVYFALGELRRLRARQLRFVPLPANFGDQLERRCQMLLDSQSAYSMAMRAYDSHWSIMAGYRVSELYEDLHQDIMALLTEVRSPDPDRRQLFEAALRLRYSILLQKAAAGLDHTLALAARTDENSKWVTWAKEALDKLRQATADERTALANVPYTREQLRRALEGLKHAPPSKKSTLKGSTSPGAPK